LTIKEFFVYEELLAAFASPSYLLPLSLGLGSIYAILDGAWHRAIGEE
jgi:hypothetical protein